MTGKVAEKYALCCEQFENQIVFCKEKFFLKDICRDHYITNSINLEKHRRIDIDQ